MIYPDDDPGTTDNRVEYLYDGLGRTYRVIDERSADDSIGQIELGGDEFSIQYEYDPRGKIASVLDQNEYTVNYAYHVNGQREAITVKDPDETEIYDVSYDYDPAGRLGTVYDLHPSRAAAVWP